MSNPGKGIILSPKHGINATIPKCWYCLEDKNEIILAGRMKGDIEAPRGAVWDKEPCDQCVKWMQQGVILIGTRDGERGSDNPTRSGHFLVVKDECIRQAFEKEAAEYAIWRRAAFVEVRVLLAIGAIEPDEVEEVS